MMLKRINPIFLGSTILISLIGLSSLAATLVDPSGVFHWQSILTKQVVFVLIGIGVYLVAAKFDYSYLKYPQVIWTIWLIAAILLVLTLFFGEARNNAHRWLTVGGVQIQASEIAKLVVIIVTAQVAGLKDKYSQPMIAGMSFLAILPLVLLVFIQPHGSMAMIMLLLWFLTLFTALGNQIRNGAFILILTLCAISIGLFTITTSPYWLILILIALFLAIFIFYSREEWRLGLIIFFALGTILGVGINYGWNNVLQDYQKERILVFSDTDGEFEQSAFNVRQAKIAIGSGQITGKGWGNGTQGRLNFLPEHQTDFLFATFAEEFGLIGSMLLLTLFLVILYIPFRSVLAGGIDDFGAVLITVITLKIMIEIFINIGTNTGLTPATGIPLPLVSAGGGITIMTFFSLGLLQGIMAKQRQV